MSMIISTGSFKISGCIGSVEKLTSLSSLTIVPWGGCHVSVLPSQRIVFSNHPPSSFKITYRSIILKISCYDCHSCTTNATSTRSCSSFSCTSTSSTSCWESTNATNATRNRKSCAPTPTTRTNGK